MVGLAAGLAVAFIAAWERLTATVSYDAATLVRGSGATVRVDRPAEGAVFMDGKHLVLLGSSGQELARNGCDLTAECPARGVRQARLPVSRPRQGPPDDAEPTDIQHPEGRRPMAGRVGLCRHRPVGRQRQEASCFIGGGFVDATA